MKNATPGPTTDLFLNLTPEKVLAAVEAGGVRVNPICYTLNSFENRVYELEMEDGDRLVSKFYRPSRWSAAQVLEEHQFLADLDEAEIPVCAVRPFPDGTTLKTIDNIHYCLFDRRGGRAPEELTDEMVERLGMLVGRMHNVGALRTAEHRIRICPETYIWDNLQWLEEHPQFIPPRLVERYFAAAEAVAHITEDYMRGVATHRIHGDLHLGNLIHRDGVLNVLDFDDMVVGPAVQDMWLLLPGRDPHSIRQRQIFIEAYEQFRAFDRSTLRLIEPLRALRVVHYATWIARRWHDPAFPHTWPHFGTDEYWEEETRDLELLLQTIRKGDESLLAQAAPEPEQELTNADFFWDMED